MTRYKQAEFADEDSSSIGSIHLNEATTSPAMQIRYHAARVRINSTFSFLLCYLELNVSFHWFFFFKNTSLWYARSTLEKILLVFSLVLVLIVIILITILSVSDGDSSTRILHVQPHMPGYLMLQII
jgi:neprilysin